MKNFIWFAVILAILFTLYHLLDTRKSIKEGFANQKCSTEDPSLTDLGANPLVDRDGQNVIVNPSGGLKNSAAITIDSPGQGWKPVINKKSNANLVINLKKLTKIHYIVTSGLKLFRVYYSRNDNNVYSYEEVLYQNVNSNSDQRNRASIHFEAPSHNEVVRFGNLTTSDGQPVFAKYIKIVPLDIQETSKRGQYKYEDESGQIGQNVGPNGIKVDLYGLEPDSAPIKGGESLLGSALFTDENGQKMLNSSWNGEKGNADPKLKITFQEDGQTVPRTIYSLIFTNASGDQFVQEFSVTYQHHKSKLTETIYNIKGNTNCGHSNKIQYYFPHPIIATSLSIKPTKLAHPGKPVSFRIVDIMGAKINEVQEKVLLDKNKNQYCSSDQPDGCGSVSDLLGKQAEIQQLCDALELQDKIKENNQKIEKNRQYLLQLEDQDQKIAKLETVIEQMKHMKSLRQKANDQGMLEQKDKQEQIDQQLQQLVADRKKNQRQFQVKLNLGQKSLDNLAKNVEKIEKAKGLEKGNDSETTPIEGFANPVQGIVQPNPNTVSQKFLNRRYNFVSNGNFQKELNAQNVSNHDLDQYWAKKKRDTTPRKIQDHLPYLIQSNLHNLKEGFTSRPLAQTPLDQLDGYATFDLGQYQKQRGHRTYHFMEDKILNQTDSDPNAKFVKENL